MGPSPPAEAPPQRSLSRCLSSNRCAGARSAIRSQSGCSFARLGGGGHPVYRRRRMTTPPRPRSVLALAALTAFLDLVGFSIIFPLFPQMLDHYLALEGPGSTIGQLVATLQGWAGDRTGASFLVV